MKKVKKLTTFILAFILVTNLILLQTVEVFASAETDLNSSIFATQLRDTLKSESDGKGGTGTNRMETDSTPRPVNESLIPITSFNALIYGDYEYTVSDGNATITNYYGTGGNIVIPDTLDSYPVIAIGEYAFHQCESLTGVIISSNVISIGDYAFSYCMMMASVTIPNSVTFIGDYAFYSSWRLTSIIIPDSVTFIGVQAFHGGGLIIVNPDNQYYSDINGVLFNKQQTTLIQYPRGRSGIYAIPDGVISIGDYAFYNCYGMVSLSIPDGVVSIGDYAFSYCYEIVSLSIPDGVISIGDYAFYRCYAMFSLTIPDSMISIGDYAFSDCDSMRGLIIPKGVKTIGINAFSGCSELTIYCFENSIAHTYAAKHGIPFEFLEGDILCNGICGDNITWVLYNTGLLEICGTGAMNWDYGDALPLFFQSHIKDLMISDGVISIGDNSFYNYVSLTNVSIPASVTYIGNYAFYHCTSLLNITVNENNPIYYDIDGVLFKKMNTSELMPQLGLMSISESSESANPIEPPKTVDPAQPADPPKPPIDPPKPKVQIMLVQYPAGKVGSYTIPDTVTDIAYKAFYGCASLTGVTISNNVAYIDGGAFRDCTALVNVNISAGVRGIFSPMFEGCISLVSINVDENNLYYSSIDGVLFDDSSHYSFIGDNLFDKHKTLIHYPEGRREATYEIPYGVTGIGYHAFSRSPIEYVSIPDSVRYIGNYAFMYCRLLASVEIPNSVVSIGDRAFDDTALYNNYPDGVFYVGNWCLGYKGSMPDNTTISLRDDTIGIGDYAFYWNSNTLSNVEIPCGVAYIGDRAFAYCESLISVTIPESVTSIEYWAFAGCISLTDITVDTNNPTYSSENGVLFNKEITELIQYPAGKMGEYSIPNSVNIIGDGAFAGCINILRMVIPDNVVNMDLNVFSGCTSLIEVFIGSGVSYLTNGTFGNCTSLISIIVDPDNSSYMDIDGVLFDKITTPPPAIGSTPIPRIRLILYPSGRIGSYTIPDGVEEIESYAFFQCTSLLSVVIPDSVTYIGYGNFFSDVDVDVTIIGIPGSYAEQYAMDNGYLFEALDRITLDTDETTNIATINVSGYAPIGSTVKIFDGDIQVRELNVNKNGRYYGDVVLVAGYGTHIIKAETTNRHGETIIATKTVVYQLDAPHLTEFALYHSGQAIDLITTDGIRQTLIFQGGRPFTFKIKTENSDQIKELYVYSERSGISKIIKAFYDDDEDVWLVSGFFDPDDKNYVPGKLSVKYIWDNSSELVTLGISNGAYQIAIDPSGYIYEGVPSNRISNAKVSVYYKEDLSNPDDPGILWDASEFDQANPILTDFEGRYAWDVPEGFWRVKAEKDGYETTYSDWLPVPPPQLEVNLNLVSKAAPVVEYANAYPDGIEIKFSKYMDIETLTSGNVNVAIGGNPVSGRIEFINSEFDPATGRFYASIIRFIPDTELSGSVQVQISIGVKSYTDINMAAGYSETVLIEVEPQQISAEDITLSYGEDGYITVVIDPAGAAEGKTVIAVSNSPDIVTVESAVVGADGTVRIRVSSGLPGDATVTLTLEGTSLQTQVNVRVNMPEPKPDKYQITATAEENGSVTGGGEYEEGTLVTLTAVADNGYVFEGWYENGERIENAEANYLFIAAEGRTLEARFKAFDGLRGDVNGDGKVDATDAAILARALATGWETWLSDRGIIVTDLGMDGIEITLASGDTSLGDVNGDGKVDATDAAILARALATGWETWLSDRGIIVTDLGIDGIIIELESVA